MRGHENTTTRAGRMFFFVGCNGAGGIAGGVRLGRYSFKPSFCNFGAITARQYGFRFLFSR